MVAVHAGGAVKERRPGKGSTSGDVAGSGSPTAPGKKTLVQRKYAGVGRGPSDQPKSQQQGESPLADALSDGLELLVGGMAQLEGGELFSGPDETVSSAIPSVATPDKSDAQYEKTMGIDKAITAKRMVPVAGVQGKTFTAVGCAGHKNGKVSFTFDRAFVGDYDYAPAGKPVRGAHVSISVSLADCGKHTDVKLVQVLRNFKKTGGKVETVQPQAEMRKRRAGTDDPKAANRGWRVDETETGRSPFYVTSDFYGNEGSSSKSAKLRDSPGDWTTDRNVGKEFRTCAVSYAGGKGTVLACVDWGYYIDATGNASFFPSTPTAHVGATSEVTDAVEPVGEAARTHQGEPEVKLLAAMSVALAVTACSNPTRTEGPREAHHEQAGEGLGEKTTMTDTDPDDNQLIERVRTASQQVVDPHTVEERVGRAALVNTDTGMPIDALRRVELVPDPEHAAETLDLESARTVIYWKRPIEADNPHVVGLQLDGTGSARVFFAIILPP